MAEYIKRTAVFEQFDNADADVCETDDFGGVDYGFGMKNIKELINAIPAADVAPVVRCKDCKHSWEDIGGLCCSHRVCIDLNVPDDFYCAYGERKDVGEK
jgi:hypothetical protein